MLGGVKNYTTAKRTCPGKRLGGETKEKNIQARNSREHVAGPKGDEKKIPEQTRERAGKRNEKAIWGGWGCGGTLLWPNLNRFGGVQVKRELVPNGHSRWQT